MAVRELAARGTAAAIVLASGYTETGEEGAAASSNCSRPPARMRILGPNTIGLVNLTDSIVLSATGALEMEHLPAGPDRRGLAERRHPRLAAVARRRRAASACPSWSRPATRSISNSPTSSTTCWTTTPPQVIALYIEGVRHPENFRAAALKAARAGKPDRRLQDRPLRSRRQGRGVAHRGAGRRRPDVRRAVPPARRDPRRRPSPTCSTSPARWPPAARCAGKRVAILTSTGGAGTLVADACGLAGFETPRARCRDRRAAWRAADRRPRRRSTATRST